MLFRCDRLASPYTIFTWARPLPAVVLSPASRPPRLLKGRFLFLESKEVWFYVTGCCCYEQIICKGVCVRDCVGFEPFFTFNSLPFQCWAYAARLLRHRQDTNNFCSCLEECSKETSFLESWKFFTRRAVRLDTRNLKLFLMPQLRAISPMR